MPHYRFARLWGLSDNLAVLKTAIPLLILTSVWLLATSPSLEPPPPRQITPSNSASSPASPLAYRADQCAGCHRMDAAFSHPVGVAPTMPVPTDLPLESGKVTCLTCHEVGGSDAHAHARQYHDGMLRRGADGARLCTQCHTDTSRSAKAMHAMALNRAHLIASPGRPAAASLGRSLDQESQNCMTCHDGTLATEVSAHSVGNFGQSDALGDHPIGMAYPDAAAIASRASGQSSLIPQGSLDPRLRLFDGRLGCGSCHSPYSTEKKQLVISNTGSKLCLSCHIV